MRVAFFIHYTSLYGANRSLINLIDGLQLHGVKAFLVAPGEGDIVDILRDKGIPVFIVPLQWWFAFGKPNRWRDNLRYRVKALKRLCTNLAAMPKVVAQLRAWNIDIVYTNSSVIPVGAFAAKWIRRPHVWHLRELGDLHYGLFPDWGKAIFNYIVSKSDAQICISEAIHSYYEKALGRGKSHVIYNGVALRRKFDRLHEKSKAEKETKRDYTFSIVGLIHPNKGQDVAIYALALLKEQFPQLRLIVAGGGDVSPLKELAAKLGVDDKVEFLGHVDNPYEVYLRSDAVLMCSRHEGMGRVTVEAMAACRPVIGNDHGATPELIEQEKTGLLYGGNAEELSICMRRFIENPDWAMALGENGWKVAREKYCIEVYAKNVYNILCRLL